MKKSTFLYILTICTLIVSVTPEAFALHIWEDRAAFADYLGTIKATGEYYTIEVDDATFDIYYGGYGSIDIGAETVEEEQPKVSSMNLNIERKSLEVSLDPINSDLIFWVLLPEEVISAEKEKYQLFIDGVETKYDLTKFPDNYAVGMILPPSAEYVEIIGTNVIPEFGSLTIAVLGITIFAVLFAFRGKSRFFNYN